MALRALCVVLILGSISLYNNLSQADELKTAEIKIEKNIATSLVPGSSLKSSHKKPQIVNLTVELALTESEHQRGLMFRKSLSAGRGMLFVFSNESPRSFWMKNTLIPLSIAFIDSKKTIFQVSDMKPMKTLIQKEIDRAESIKPAKYVLEVPQGWFSANQIDVGSKIIWPTESNFSDKLDHKF
jgi:uncharacterized protein